MSVRNLTKNENDFLLEDKLVLALENNIYKTTNSSNKTNFYNIIADLCRSDTLNIVDFFPPDPAVG